MSVTRLVFPLHPSQDQRQRLIELQSLFAEACSWLARTVRETRCWNRVALHHLAYRQLRETFPQLGSQMACNVIYSVCKSARQVYQGENSPWKVDSKDESVLLPLLRFAPTAPVYFDQRTLSVRKGRLSLYTLDGRMQFDIRLEQEQAHLFETTTPKETVLARGREGFFLTFFFEKPAPKEQSAVLPDYLLVQEAAAS